MHCCTNDQYPQEEAEYTTATMNSINEQYPQEEAEYIAATMNSIPKRKLSSLLHKN
jgi:hypothetical protein